MPRSNTYIHIFYFIKQETLSKPTKNKNKSNRRNPENMRLKQISKSM